VYVRERGTHIAIFWLGNLKGIRRHKLEDISNGLKAIRSAVGIPTGYGLADRRVGVRVSVRSRIFISSYRPDRL
jgi:hypothetical protein